MRSGPGRGRFEFPGRGSDRGSAAGSGLGRRPRVLGSEPIPGFPGRKSGTSSRSSDREQENSASPGSGSLSLGFVPGSFPYGPGRLRFRRPSRIRGFPGIARSRLRLPASGRVPGPSRPDRGGRLRVLDIPAGASGCPGDGRVPGTRGQSSRRAPGVGRRSAGPFVSQDPGRGPLRFPALFPRGRPPAPSLEALRTLWGSLRPARGPDTSAPQDGADTPGYGTPRLSARRGRRRLPGRLGRRGSGIRPVPGEPGTRGANFSPGPSRGSLGSGGEAVLAGGSCLGFRRGGSVRSGAGALGGVRRSRRGSQRRPPGGAEVRGLRHRPDLSEPARAYIRGFLDQGFPGSGDRIPAVRRGRDGRIGIRRVLRRTRDGLPSRLPGSPGPGSPGAFGCWRSSSWPSRLSFFWRTW